MGDDLADRRSRNLARLVLHDIGNAELSKHLGRDVDAAGAVGIGDRLRREQRALDRFHRADVRLRRARLHGDADRRSRQVDLAAGNDLALAGEIGEGVAHHDQDIGRLAALQPDRDGVGRGPHRGPIFRQHLVAGGLLELRHEHLVGRRQAARDHHPDFGSLGRAGQPQDAQKAQSKISECCCNRFHRRSSPTSPGRDKARRPARAPTIPSVRGRSARTRRSGCRRADTSSRRCAGTSA